MLRAPLPGSWAAAAKKMTRQRQGKGPGAAALKECLFTVFPLIFAPFALFFCSEDSYRHLQLNKHALPLHLTVDVQKQRALKSKLWQQSVLHHMIGPRAHHAALRWVSCCRSNAFSAILHHVLRAWQALRRRVGA